MPLSQEQIDKLDKWFEAHNVQAICPLCGQQSWTGGDIISAPRWARREGVSIGGSSIPMIQLICDNCAYIQLFAAAPILEFNK
jgi:hypothetical protein